MRLFILTFCLLFACSCAGGKVQDRAPEKIVKKEGKVLLAPVKVEQIKKVEPVQSVELDETKKVFADYTFSSIVRKEGIPFENIVPRSKEQVVIYKKNDYFSFYYLNNNKLILKKNYSFAELDKIKAENKYPDKVLKDLGAI